MTDINIKESIYDKHSWFNIKKFGIGGLKFERPTKVIDAKNTTKNMVGGFKREFENVILESSKVIKPSSVETVLKTTNDEQIKDLFGFSDWMSDYHSTMALTFQFNPYKQFNNLKYIYNYFYYYSNLPSLFLQVPNITPTKREPDGKKQIQLIDIKGYLKFVDEIYEVLGQRNKRPIFVPVSLKFSIEDAVRLATYYSKKEYFYLWFDFEGSAITKINKGRIDAILETFKENGRINDIVVYSTNLKREIISNIKFDKSPASDVLSSLVGANFVGINREPQRPIKKQPLFSWGDDSELITFLNKNFGFDWIKTAKIRKPDNNTINVFTDKNHISIRLDTIKNKIVLETDDNGVKNYILKKEKGKLNIYEPINKELRQHKSRVFDSNSYYYIKTVSLKNEALQNELLNKPNYNILFNSKKLDDEFIIQTNHFLEEMDIKEYIADKSMLKEYKSGDLIKQIFSSGDKKITEWF